MRDEQLVRKIQQGGSQYAEELVRRHYGAVLRYCAWHCPGGTQAEDLAQETFLRAFQALGRYQGGGKFRAWLYTIARNLCIDAARRPVPLVPEEERTAEEDGFARLEDEDAFLRRLQALPRPQQEALLLRFGHGLGFKEIGQITGVPPRTAQSRVRLGLTALKREWRD